MGWVHGSSCVYIYARLMDRHRKKHYLAIRGTRLKNLLEKYLLFSQVKEKKNEARLFFLYPGTKSISFQNNMLP